MQFANCTARIYYICSKTRLIENVFPLIQALTLTLTLTLNLALILTLTLTLTLTLPLMRNNVFGLTR